MWNKQTEDHFKAHKKEVYKTRNSVLNLDNAAKSNFLTADLASIFRVARKQFKQPETAQNATSRIGSLKQLNEFLGRRRSVVGKEGYSSEKVAQGLEELYAAVIRLVFAERILNDFQSNADEYLCTSQ